jgi:hypothetical protein
LRRYSMNNMDAGKAAAALGAMDATAAAGL